MKIAVFPSGPRGLSNHPIGQHLRSILRTTYLVANESNAGNGKTERSQPGGAPEMIECSSDDAGMRTKYVELAKSILSETGSRSIRNLVMIAMMKEGYFMISADLKSTTSPLKLTECGDLERADGRIVLHLNPSMEPRLPEVLDLLANTYGKERVKALSRYDISIEGTTIEEMEALNIDTHQNEMASNAFAVIMYLLPEGFRIMKTLRSRSKLTILCSQQSLKKDWIEKMGELHKGLRTV